MDFKEFLRIIEIKKKFLVVPPILIAALFSFAHYKSINIINSSVLLVGVFVFYMFTSTLKFYLVTVKQRKTLFKYITHTHEEMLREEESRMTVAEKIEMAQSDEPTATEAFSEFVENADPVQQADLIQAMPDEILDQIVENKGIDTPVSYDLKYEHNARDIMGFLGAISIGFGIGVFIISGPLALAVEIICAIFYLCYDWGLIPVRRTTFAPFLKAFMMSSMMFFLGVYVNTFTKQQLVLDFFNWDFIFKMDIRVVTGIFMVSMPLFLLMSAMYLAESMHNYITDDANEYMTLANYINLKPTRLVCTLMIYLAYIWVLIAVVLGFLPPVTAMTFFTIIYTFRFVKKLNQNYTFEDTTNYVSNILSTFSFFYAFTILVGILIQLLVTK
jgi:1,4-dihydroxy-2-naphthoate octaprenyltransferase